MKKSKSNRTGALKRVTTGIPPVGQSSSVELTLSPTSPIMSDTLGLNHQKSHNSLPTPNLVKTPNAAYAIALGTFAEKLGALVEWRHVELGDGRRGWALFFPDAKWSVNPKTHKIAPLGALVEKG